MSYCSLNKSNRTEEYGSGAEPGSDIFLPDALRYPAAFPRKMHQVRDGLGGGGHAVPSTQAHDEQSATYCDHGCAHVGSDGRRYDDERNWAVERCHDAACGGVSESEF